MPHSISFLTTERAHLFAVSALLCRAIDDMHLRDPARPVTVAVRGSLRSGKKIFPDAGREALMTGATRMEGRENGDEYWRGPRISDGTDIEIGFINPARPTAGCPMPYSDALAAVLCPGLAECQARLIARFQAQRQLGGLSFIHNSDVFAAAADLDICLDDGAAKPIGRQSRTLKTAPGGLRQIFDAYRVSYPWTRYLSVEVRDDRLLQSPRFREAFNKLCLADDRMVDDDGMPPVFGVNLPSHATAPARP